MKTILVATDFSKGAENATSYARQIAQKFNYKLAYLHIVNIPIVDPIVSSNVVADTIDELKNDSIEKLKGYVEGDKINGIVSEYHTSFNDIIGLIDEVAQKEDVEMVVVGRSGQRTFLDKILGSTAQGLITKIKQPLLVIPEDYAGDLFENLCYSTKLEFDELKYLGHAMVFAEHSDKPLMLTHVIEEFPLDLNENQQFIDEINKTFDPKHFTIVNHAAEFYQAGIVEFIKKENISLLFVTTQKRGFLEGLIDPSKTKSLINKANIPVMVYYYSE